MNKVELFTQVLVNLFSHIEEIEMQLGLACSIILIQL